MLNPQLLTELSANLGKLIPADMAYLRDDLEKNARVVIQSFLSRLDLVTREEFDVQTAVLEKTRARLEALEKKLAALE